MRLRLMPRCAHLASQAALEHDGARGSGVALPMQTSLLRERSRPTVRNPGTTPRPAVRNPLSGGV